MSTFGLRNKVFLWQAVRECHNGPVFKVQSSLKIIVWSEEIPSEVLKLLCVMREGDTMSCRCVLKSCVWNMVSVAPELSVEVSVVTEVS